MSYTLIFTGYCFFGVLEKMFDLASTSLSNTLRFCWEGLAAAPVTKGSGVFKGLFLRPVESASLWGRSKESCVPASDC